jgi:hypothetical protein
MKVEIHRGGVNGSDILLVPHGRERWQGVLRVYGELGAETEAVTIYALGVGVGPYIYVNDSQTVVRMGEHEGCVRVK